MLLPDGHARSGNPAENYGRVPTPGNGLGAQLDPVDHAQTISKANTAETTIAFSFFDRVFREPSSLPECDKTNRSAFLIQFMSRVPQGLHFAKLCSQATQLLITALDRGELWTPARFFTFF
jgi:hypothetical protein